MDLFKDIAAGLGGTFVPYIFDGTEMKDRCWIFLGDTSSWRTPQIFLHKDRYPLKKRIAIWTCTQPVYLTEGRVVYYYGPRLGTSDEITVSATLSSADIVKDIQKRLLPYYLEYHPRVLEHVDAAEVKRLERAAWCAKVGIDLEAGRGQVWRGKGSAYAEITQVGSDVTMKLNWISRDKAEAVIKFLKESES